MTMIFNFTIIYIIKVFMFQSFFCLKDSQNFFMQSSPLYTLALISIPSNVYIVDNECPQAVCSPTFVLNDVLELFLHPSVHLIKDSKSV